METYFQQQNLILQKVFLKGRRGQKAQQVQQQLSALQLEFQVRQVYQEIQDVGGFRRSLLEQAIQEHLRSLAGPPGPVLDLLDQ